MRNSISFIVFLSFRNLALLVLVLGGCDGGPKLYPVTGKVMYQNQPADGATIVLVPANGEGANAKNASGKVQPDGSFTLETYAHGAGAFPGNYQVSVSWFPENAREQDNPVNKLPAKFSNPSTSGLTATIKEESNELPPFQLTQ